MTLTAQIAEAVAASAASRSCPATADTPARIGLGQVLADMRR
jgi:hypothetical protein